MNRAEKRRPSPLTPLPAVEGNPAVSDTNVEASHEPHHWSADFSLQQLPWNQRFREILQTKVRAPSLRFMVPMDARKQKEALHE